MLPLHHRGCRSTSTSPSASKQLGTSSTAAVDDHDDIPPLYSTTATATTTTTTSPSLSSAAGLLIERVFSVAFIGSSSSENNSNETTTTKTRRSSNNKKKQKHYSTHTRTHSSSNSSSNSKRTTTSCWRMILLLLPLFLLLAYYSQQRIHILFRHLHHQDYHNTADNDQEYYRRRNQHHENVATDTVDNGNGKDDNDVLDVLIVGGGWAGLAVAHTLQQNYNNTGIKFEILEARDYIGGRSHTIHPFDSAQSLPVEVGSGWLYKNTEVYDIFVDNNIPFGKIHHDEDMARWGLYYNNNAAGGGDLFQVNDDNKDHDDDHNNNTHSDSSSSSNGSGHNEITNNERAELLDQLWWEEFVPFSTNRRKQIHANETDDQSYANILDEFLLEKKKSPLVSEKREFDRTRQFLHAMVHAQIEIEYAASTHELSARQVGKSVNDCLFCGANYLVQVDGGGFDKAISTLADPLQQYIHLNHVVTQIQYNNGKGGGNHLARVTYQIKDDDDKKVGGHNGHRSTAATKRAPAATQQQQQQHTKWAKTVLVTVPLGVLKHGSIKFIPPLPQSKQNAIDFVGFGVLNKCVLYWDKKKVEGSHGNNTWWPHGREILTLITDQVKTSGNWTSFFNEKEIGNGGHYVLSAWTGGDNALAMESQSDSAIVAQVMSNLRSMLGGEALVPAPSKYVISRWGQDEFARGSYSFSSVGHQGLMDSAREELGAQVGEQLFWAGEATHYKWSGTTVGAYRSGVTAVEDILLALSHGLPPPPPADKKEKVTTTAL